MAIAGLIGCGLAVAMGLLRSPLDSFFEVDAKTYHNVAAVVESARSHGTQGALIAQVKSALERDGKLTQANMRDIWPRYMDALPDAFDLPVPGAADLDTERAQLAALVGAQPALSR